MSKGDALRRLTDALADHGCTVRGSSAQCPAHEDRNASLSIGRRKDGAGVVVNCHAGCETDAVLEALGMSAADLFDEPRQREDRRQVVAEYDYVDEDGTLLFRSVRYQPKDFRQYRIVGGRKEYRLGDVRRVLYRLPQVLEAVNNGRPVYVCEGEKDVHALEAAGVVATCNPMGAGKWRREFADVLTGADVVIIADRDEPGREHAGQVADSLNGKAGSVRIVEAAEGKDSTDHLAAGHGLGDFVPVALSAADADSNPDADPVGARLTELRAALLDSDALDSIPAPQPVIDGLLYRDGIAWLYGKPGTYKSIIAIDWACCVSAGLPWQGRETVQGPVLYLYIEGRAGLRQRVRAWEDRAGCKTEAVFLPIAVQLLSPVDLAAFTALIAEMQPALVVIDTQARVTVGAEENSAMEMGKVVDAAGHIISACRPCLLILHHEGRNGDNPRGSIAIEGAATSLFRADRDGDRITLENKRQRDTVEADEIVLRAIPRLQSVVVDSNEAHWSTPLPSASEKLVLQVLADVFLESGASATTLIKATKLADSTFYYAIKNLVSRGEVVSNGTRGRSHYELPPRGDLQLTPMNSNSNASPYSNSNPPYKGVGGLETTGGPDSGEQWPKGTYGEAAGQ